MAEIEMQTEIDENEVYSDGDRIEEEILEYVKTHDPGDYDDILAEDRRWPVFYHLTDMRENILSWYDFEPDSEVLEIGAGMGALTGLLCRKVKSVTAVELSGRRASVIYERCRNYDNLLVRVGNFNRMEFTQKYDYITLIGVLEYAPGFTESGDPHDFLKKMKSLLKPGGKLLIAIENRFGLKYWCGANEDHTGKPYSGINDYRDDAGVRTYSRKELSSLLQESGFDGQKFFYPMPDYKLPQVIYSDDYLPKDKLMGRIRHYYLNQDALLADSGVLFEDVIQNDVFPFFANSYFVECAMEEETKATEVAFAVYTTERKREYQVTTVIKKTDKKSGSEKDSNDYTVLKYATTDEGQKHIKEITELAGHYKGKNLLPYETEGDHLVMPFIKAPTLEQVLRDTILSGNEEEALNLVRKFYDLIKESSEMEEVEGQTVLKYGFLDLTFSNCFVENDTFTFYDQEWHDMDSLPSYILYRAIALFYSENGDLEEILPCDKMYEIAEIDKQKRKSYEDQQQSLYEKIFNQQANPIVFMSGQSVRMEDMLDGFVGGRKKKGKVYFDLGKGYSEEDTQSFFYEGEYFDINLPLEKEVKSVRIDPVEDRYCILKEFQVYGDGNSMEYCCVNGEEFEGIALFRTDDPQYEVVLKKPIQTLRIRGAISAFDGDSGLVLADKYENRIVEIEQEKESIQQEKESIQQEKDADRIELNAYVVLADAKDRLLIEKQKRTDFLEARVEALEHRLRYTLLGNVIRTRRVMLRIKQRISASYHYRKNKKKDQ